MFIIRLSNDDLNFEININLGLPFLRTIADTPVHIQEVIYIATLKLFHNLSHTRIDLHVRIFGQIGQLSQHEMQICIIGKNIILVFGYFIAVAPKQ